MKIYFYHTRLTAESYAAWKADRFPGHLLYGQPLLEEYGISSVMHRYRPCTNRLLLMLYVLKEVVCCREKFDAVYGTSFRGLELLIFLRALGLYRKPIIVWHHTALRSSSNRLREALSRFFYRGIDHAFLFSRRLIRDSIPTGKLREEQLQLVHWGADLDFYDHLMAEFPVAQRTGAISTGKENRDVLTMLRAFTAAEEPLEVYIAAQCGAIDYQQLIAGYPLPPHITVHFTDGVIPHQLAKEVAKRSCVAICCLPFSYTVGLTTVVEAMALGIPILCTENPYFEMDIAAEGIGITLPAGDVAGWQRAIRFLQTHPDEAKAMGQRSRELAEQRFNLRIFAGEVAEALLRYDPNKQNHEPTE